MERQGFLSDKCTLRIDILCAWFGPSLTSLSIQLRSQPQLSALNHLPTDFTPNNNPWDNLEILAASKYTASSRDLGGWLPSMVKRMAEMHRLSYDEGKHKHSRETWGGSEVLDDAEHAECDFANYLLEFVEVDIEAYLFLLPHLENKKYSIFI